MSIATFFPLSAEALYQYEYTSNPIYGGYYVWETEKESPLIGNITVSFRSANLLKGGESLDDISNFIMNFQSNIDDAQFGWPFESDPTNSDSSVGFKVDGVNEYGTPNQWDISVIRFEPIGPPEQTIMTWITSNNWYEGVDSGGSGSDVSWGGDHFSNPGTWTVTSPVPEHEPYAMMLAGLGMIGFVSRRKNSK